MFTRKNLIILSRILFSLFITCLFMTCDPGLGKAVDTQAPKVSIDYPAPKEVLKDSFTMTGVASDEVKVASCEVAFRNIKTGSVYKFPANVANDKFSVTINTPKPDGSFELPDGDYNVTVSVSDAYRNSTQDIVYTIDNTAPTVLITSPNSYSESNWPNMYKTFSIKGEVYDATNISEVIVYLVDVNGTVLKQVVAEGTNTFSARFDNPFGEEKVCFYYAVAKDAGGNVNTYCYHSSDIRKLLANASQHSETTSFPSINSIGYVDQGQEKNLTDQIDESALIKVKIDNNKAEKKADSFPGFNYFAKDTAQVQWLNISKESPAGIAIGTPVLGTIMPPTDQSAFDYDSITVWIASRVHDPSDDINDPSAEIKFEPFSDSNKLECCTIRDDSEDGNKQVKLKPVGESINFQIDSHPGNNDNWKTGDYKVKIYFKTDSNVEGSDECIFKVTSGAPKLTEGNFAENEFSSYYRGYMTAETVSSNKNYLSGKSLTSDEASPVTLSWKYVGSTISGDKVDSPEETKVPEGDGSYKIDININANTHENDGEYTYTITADPDSTLSTVISRVVVVDTTNPEILFNNLENDKIVESKVYKVKGNIEDANGISKLDYKLYKSDNDNQNKVQILLDGTLANTSDWVNLTEKLSSFEIELSNLEKNKKYELKLRATDVAGNETGEDDFVRTFTLDGTNPEVTATVSPLIMYDNDGDSTEEETVNGTIKVNVKVTDDSKLQSVYYTFDTLLAENADWSSQNKFEGVELSNGKIIEIDTTDTTKYADKSKLPLRIKAIDGAGNYTIKIVNPVINQESDKPMIEPSNFDKPKRVEKFEDSGWNGSITFNVFGSSNPNMIFTVSDDDSVKEYFAKVNDGEYVKVADVNSAQKIVTYSVENLSFGRHTVTFKIIDVNNIAVEKTYYVAIDDGQPTLVVNNVNNEYVGDSFNISGSVIDKNGIYEVKINNQKLTIGNGLTENADGYKFTYSFPVPEEQVLIQIIAVDLIGNTSIKELTYCVDKTSPVLDVFATDSAYVDIEYPSLRIAGTATDGDLSFGDNGISGIDQVRLKIGSSITSVDDADSILAIGKIENGVMSWSSPLDFTGKLAGNYTVYIQAFDHAGNKSEEKTITVYVDTDKPKLNHGYVDNFVGNYKGNFVITGTATDASGVKSVTAKIQGATNNLVGTYAETSDSSESIWSFNIPANVGDGQLTILVTALDGCGKSVQETFTATLDTVAPSVTFTDISDDDSNPETVDTSKTTDKPRVSVTYSDITSGVNKIDYAFYYYDPEGNVTSLTPDANGFVDYSVFDENAKGAFTKSKSFSGTVVMKMAESTGSKGPFVFTDSDTDSDTDGIWYVKVTVTDEAGNSATYDSPYFYVDQHKPTLDVTKPSDGTLKKQNDSLTVTGTTSDSLGGQIDRVVVKITHPNYNASQLEQFTKTFTKDGSNGTEILSKVSGENYSFEYTWNEVNSPFKYFNEYEITVLTYDIAGNESSVKRKVYCDNEAPSISFTRPYSYSVDSYGNVTVGTVVNSPIGDTSIKASANDNMANIYYQVGGTVTIDSEGTLGQSDYKIKKLTVADGGVISDKYGTSVSDVKFDDANVSLAGTWNKLTDANHNFDVGYNTLTFNNNKMTYHVAGDKSTIMTLDVHLVAVDKAGNINYCKYPLKVDTDTDKPNLLILSPKTVNAEANVGGTATVSGTVNDDNAVHSVWMQVELVNGNYNGDILTGNSTFGIDYSNVSTYNMSNPQVLVENNDGTYSLEDSTSYFTDRTKWYRVNIGAENSKSTTWNMVLNKFKEFDNTSLLTNGYLQSAVEQTELIVRVRALDTKSGNDNISTDAKLGDVTEFRLVIDAGSPSIVINNYEDFPTEGSYIGGTLKFDVDFSDDETITEYSIIAYSSASGDNSSYTITEGSNVNGYGPNVPIRDITVDTQNIYNACGNLIQIKFFAKDKSKDTGGEQIAAKESYLTFKYTIDNSAPEANNIATIDGKNYRITTESVDGDVTGALRETAERGNHLRILSDQAAFIGNVEDEDNGSGVDYVMLYFTKDGYLYNPSQNNVKESLSNKVYLHDENGNQVEVDFPVSSLNDIARAPSSNGGKVTPYIVIDRAEGMNDSGSNGDLDGYDENLKANGDWVVYIKSSNLPDGIYDIHYVVVDFARNARYYSDTMLVQNYAPTINSIVLATDIDGDGQASIGNDNKGDEYQKFVTGEFTSTYFNVRNSKLKIKVNVTGGTGTLKYYLRYKTTNGEVTTNSSNPGYSTGEFEVTDFLGDSSIPVDYVVWVEDSVEKNLSLSSGETTIDMIMDNVDDINPVAQFFELNTIVENSSVSNSNRGSLYKDGSVKGHIETRQNSPVDNDSEQDPDVSGTIILRGEVLDNQRIESIVLRLNDTNVTIAKWNPNLSLLELKDANAKIYDSLGLLGHYVEWQYAWDTNSFAKYDTDVKVIVTDSAGKVSGNKDYSSDNTNTPRTESNKFTLDNWGYNSMTVDVVPYITGLGTTLSRIEKRNPSVYGRSTLGKYPVYYYRKTVSEGKESEEITVEGFNILSGSTVTFEGGATTSLDVNKVFTLPENAKSGKIFVTVSEVPSLNNANDNGAVGSSGEYYNQKPNGQNNDLLTDDIELLIWEINSKAAIAESGELSEVMMHVNPYNGMLGFAFAHSQDLASYPNGNNNSYETWITDWTGVNQISFAYDKNGNMFGTNGGTDTYTPNKKVGRLGLISSHWGVITNTSASNDWYSGYTKYRRLRLEYLGLLRNNAYASNVYRFAKGDAIQLATTYSETSGTNLYMLYYDNTLGELKFKAGNFDSHEGAIYNSASGDKWTKSDLFFGDFSDDAHYEKASDSSNNYEPTYKTISIVANQNGANGDSYVRPGIYYSVDAISSSDGKSDVVVAVWYDDVNKTLWYSYLVNPLANAGKRDANGAISTEWATPIAILDGHAGGYCAIKVDDAGHIHIAAYSRNDAGSLYYAYLNSYDADYNENENLVAVDAYGSTGQYITMEVAKDGKGKYIPYIGYYMSSMSYPKYAYLVDTESAKVGGTYYPKPGVDENSMFTGAWETVLLPTTSTIVIDDINIGVYKNSDGTLKSIPKQTESVGVKNGIAGGNDTSNPIFAYGISQTGSGYIETAQLK